MVMRWLMPSVPADNPDHVGVEDRRHAGSRPRGRTDRRQLQLGILYWTSKGSLSSTSTCGSTGYGRSYRQALNGSWGVADVEDCVAAAAIAERGDVPRTPHDPRRFRGGFTVLSALAPRRLRCRGVPYGVADLEALATDTTSSSRYLDTLVGPWPEAKRSTTSGRESTMSRSFPRR